MHHLHRRFLCRVLGAREVTFWHLCRILQREVQDVMCQDRKSQDCQPEVPMHQKFRGTRLLLVRVHPKHHLKIAMCQLVSRLLLRSRLAPPEGQWAKLFVMQVEARSAEDTSDVSVLYDMADKAVSMATFRQTEQVSFLQQPARVSFVCLRHLRHLPPTSSGIGCTRTAPPKYAGDALLTTPGQDLHRVGAI